MAHSDDMFNTAWERCVASREHIRTSRELIELSHEAMESSRVMLAATDLLMSKRERTTAQYEVRFVDRGGSVYCAIVLDRDCDTDAAAVREAHAQDVQSIGAGFDVWRGGQLVHQHRRS
jgi:hypothetical protein